MAVTCNLSGGKDLYRTSWTHDGRGCIGDNDINCRLGEQVGGDRPCGEKPLTGENGTVALMTSLVLGTGFEPLLMITFARPRSGSRHPPIAIWEDYERMIGLGGAAKMRRDSVRAVGGSKPLQGHGRTGCGRHVVSHHGAPDGTGPIVTRSVRVICCAAPLLDNGQITVRIAPQIRKENSGRERKKVRAGAGHACYLRMTAPRLPCDSGGHGSGHFALNALLGRLADMAVWAKGISCG